MAFDDNHHHQAYVLRLQYLKELENLIEWIVILSASFTITTKQVNSKPTPALDNKSRQNSGIICGVIVTI